MVSQTQTAPPQTSIVNVVARRVASLALILDVVTLLIRIAETTIQITLPDLSMAWTEHHGSVLTVLFYTAGITVVIGLSIGVSASLFMSMPLLYEIDKRIDAVTKIKNRRARKEMTLYLTTKRSRYFRYILLAVLVPLLFGASYFLSNLGLGWLKYVTAIADIAAPIIVLFVLSQTEREHDNSDPQEQAIKKATDVMLENMNHISSRDGTLTRGQANVLKAGTEGDIEAMIDAATPEDTSDRWYTIVDICKRLGFSIDRDSSQRKKVYRIVSSAYSSRLHDVRRSAKGRGYLVPGRAFDALFGDLLSDAPSKPFIEQPKDAIRTKDTTTEAVQASPVGQDVVTSEAVLTV